MVPSTAHSNVLDDRMDLLNRTIHSVYQSVLDVDPWRACLALIAEYFESTSATIVVRPSTSTDLGFLVTFPSGGEAFEIAYKATWFKLDPFLELPIERVMLVSDMMSNEQWQGSEYFRDFLRHGMPTDAQHAMGVDIATKAGTISRLRIFRYQHLPPFTDSDKQQLATFVPHIKQALTLSAHVNRNESEREIYEEGLDHLNIGVIVLDEKCQLLRANSVACHILNGGDGLKLVGRELEAFGAVDTRELRRLLAAARLDSASVAAMSLSRRAGRRKLATVVRGIPMAEESEGRAQPAVAIFLRDPDAAGSPAQEIARQLFDFTPAEANLAIELVNGLSLDEAAEKLAIRRNTARAHLRSIFMKAGVTRQSELVRLLMNGVMGLPTRRA